MTAQSSALSERPQARITRAELITLAAEFGADDCGLVSIDDPKIDEDRPYILSAFPQTKILLVLLGRMHREPVRSPARSIANLEFHQSGDHLDHLARRIVRSLEDRGIPALNPAMAFPMEMQQFPERGWVVSHKRAAEAAGLGVMGIHRSLIHPKFGSFVLLNTILIASDIDSFSQPLDTNPCLGCKLCVAACPVGAIKSDGGFDFSACFNHNYQQFMGGFANWVEDIADSRSRADYRSRHTYAETVERWQSLSYKPNYNAAYCIAVCPAGEDVIGPYLADKASHRQTVVRPLQDKQEPIYVVKDSDADDHVKRRFPHKTARIVRSSARATNIRGFFFGLRLVFQAGRAKNVDALYHFTFSGAEPYEGTVIIRAQKLEIYEGHMGKPDLRVLADSRTWLRFVNGETSLVWSLLTRRIRLRGSPRLLQAFGRCFPS